MVKLVLIKAVLAFRHRLEIIHSNIKLINSSIRPFSNSRRNRFNRSLIKQLASTRHRRRRRILNINKHNNTHIISKSDLHH
jgi:hypothetical protein